MRRYESAKYLRVTMYDNDFTCSLLQLADILYEFFCTTRFPEDNDLPILKVYVQHLWFSIHNIYDLLGFNKNCNDFKETHLKNFIPHLEFVDYLDIPTGWHNDADVYIPMFENAEIIRV